MPTKTPTGYDDTPLAAPPMSSKSPKNHLIRGAAWTVGTRTLVKILGFINTIIMARLLMPEDYGLMAMSMLIVGLVQTLLEFGAVTALMRKEHIDKDDIDSAWTLRLMQCGGAAVLISVAPIFAVSIFDEPRLTYILWTMAASTVAMGLGSLAPALATKTFDFSLAFKLDITGKFVSVAATIVFGFWLRDYRALVIGIALGYITPAILTYAWHPARHRINVSKIPEIWALTKWLMVANVGGFVLRKGDELAAAKIGTAAEYGNYNVGADVGSLPVAEVGPAMLRALLPVLSTIQSDIERTNQAIVKTMAALGTLIWPLGLGTFVTASSVTMILLGPKWQSAATFVGVYGVVAVLQTLASPLKTLLTLRAHTRIQSTLVWLEFLTFVGVAMILTPRYGLIGLAWARLIASALNVAYMLMAAKSYCQLSIAKMAPHLLRPFVGAALMAGLVMHLPKVTTHLYVDFAISVICGATFYVLWCTITWLIMGKPEGLESTVWDRLSAINKK